MIGISTNLKLTAKSRNFQLLRHLLGLAHRYRLVLQIKSIFTLGECT